jgi:hypothetical protein
MNRLTIIISLLLSSYSCFSQTWCAPGATWHYKDIVIWWPAYRNGITELKYTNTVTINSITCNEITRTFTGQIGGTVSPVGTYTYYPLYTYENNSVYYLYDNETNTFDTIANFNASIGDKWEIPFYSTSCSTKPKLTVTDIGNITINSQGLRRIVVSSGWSTDTIIERIGGFNHFFAPYYKCIADAPNLPDFICYQDDNFPLYKKYNAHNCFYDVGLNELEANCDLLTIYPVPINGNLNLNAQNGGNYIYDEVIIYNSFGELIRREKIEFVDQKAKLEISELSNGVYFLYLKNQNHTSINKRFVVLR